AEVAHRSGAPVGAADDSPGRKPGVNEKMKSLPRCRRPERSATRAATKPKCIFPTRSAFAAREPSAERCGITSFRLPSQTAFHPGLFSAVPHKTRHSSFRERELAAARTWSPDV